MTHKPDPSAAPAIPKFFPGEYLSKTPLHDISAFLIERRCGKNEIAIGEKARALFKNGLPHLDTDKINIKAKTFLGEDLQYLTEPIFPEDTRRLNLSDQTANLGLYFQFVREFLQLRLTVQGREFSGPESLDTKLQAFVQQVGGKQRAKIISRLMHRGLVDMALTLFATDQKISSVVNGETFKEARIHSQGGSSRVCLDNGHRAVLNLKSNALGNNGVYQCIESQVIVIGLDRTPQVDEAKAVVLYASTD